jgi:hypothetical protein
LSTFGFDFDFDFDFSELVTPRQILLLCPMSQAVGESD